MSVSQAWVTCASGASVVTVPNPQMPRGQACLISSQISTINRRKSTWRVCKNFLRKGSFLFITTASCGEEPQEPAEGPGLGRRALSLMQPSRLSEFLSALGQFEELPYGMQKQLQSSKVIIPKSATCETCKGREKKMMVCGQCHQAYYCSRECQKKDWKQHKKSCALRKE